MLPKNRPPTHPGKMLLMEFLEPMGISQADFAKHLGWTYARLNEIVNGKRGVSANSALAFAEAFKMEPQFWMNLQRDWDLWHEMQERESIEPIEEAA
jgi:addiction module HigA family antidote